MQMRALKLAALAFGLVSLTTLTGCGGGGDGGGGSPAQATITLLTATPSTPVGTYQSSQQEKFTESTAIGPATSYEFDSGNVSIGYSQIDSDPTLYVVGFADPSGYYVCVSARAATVISLPACPAGVQVNQSSKTVTLTNALLEEADTPSLTVRVNGSIHWN